MFLCLETLKSFSLMRLKFFHCISTRAHIQGEAALGTTLCLLCIIVVNTAGGISVLSYPCLLILITHKKMLCKQDEIMVIVKQNETKYGSEICNDYQCLFTGRHSDILCGERPLNRSRGIVLR